MSFWDKIYDRNKPLISADFVRKVLDKGLVYTYKTYTDVTLKTANTVGKYLGLNGTTETTLTGFNVTKIDVRKAKGVRVYGYYSNTICALAFRNEYGVVVGSVQIATGSGYATFESDIPLGAVEAVTSYSTSSNRAFKQETYVIINDEIYEDVTLNAQITVGKYLGVNGLSETTLSGFNISEIDVRNVKAVRVYGYYSNVLCALCFKNSAGDVIGTVDTVLSSSQTSFYREVPAGAVKAVTSYSTTSSRTLKIQTCNLYLANESADSASKNWNSLEGLKRITIIPIFGQSLSIGADSTPAISLSQKYNIGLMFNGGIRAAQKTSGFFTAFQSLVESDSSTNGETPASGMAEGLAEEIQRLTGLPVKSEFWDGHQFLFVSCGEGSKTILDLTTDYYAGLKNAVQGAKNICSLLGYNLSVRAWVWMQGETDQKDQATDYATYKARLLALATNMDIDLRAITGEAAQIKCICYQTASQNIVSTVKSPTFANTAMDVPTAQMELIRDSSYFIAASPVYVLDHSALAPIHLTSIGEKMFGFYAGNALANYIVNGHQKRGVTPKSYAITGNTVDIIFNVQAPPLRFAADWVKQVTNQGFVILNSGNTNIITSVNVFYDTVTIICSESPLNAKLFYGFNGDASYDGRVRGSRGNLSDSQQAKIAILNKDYSLSNYAFAFSKLLSASSGSV